MSKDDTRMWGGRFSEPTDEFVQAFTASVAFDRRLAHADIAGSRAHATMLEHIGVLSAVELAAGIRKGEYSSRDVVESVSARIADRNPGLNAIVYDCCDEALVAAGKADAALAEGSEVGPLSKLSFFCLPIMIEDTGHNPCTTCHC